MARNPLVRLFREDRGMETMDWALVGMILVLVYVLHGNHWTLDLSAALRQFAR